MRRKYVIAATVVLLVGAIGGASAAIGLGLDREIGVAYGEVTYTDSPLQVVDYSEDGPGINTYTVNVTVENMGSSSLTGNVSVYLMDGSTVVSSGYTSGTTWSSGEERTVGVDVDNVKEHAYEQVDIKVVEE